MRCDYSYMHLVMHITINDIKHEYLDRIFEIYGYISIQNYSVLMLIIKQKTGGNLHLFDLAAPSLGLKPGIFAPNDRKLGVRLHNVQHQLR